VKNNSDTWIKANENRIVGGNLTEHVGGKHQTTVDGISKYYSKGNHQFTCDGDGHFEMLKYTLWTTDAIFESAKVAMNFNQWDCAISGPTKLKATEVHIKADKIVLEGSQKISMKVGGNLVVIDPSGVSIVGTMVKINSGGGADPASEAENKDPADSTDPDMPGQPEDPLTPAA
jgi:type VI secretion system secreted protein VgrG